MLPTHLVRSSPLETVQDYELKTVTFGVDCALCLAIRTLLQLADGAQHPFPLASEILRDFKYVDDTLAGARDVKTAIRARD